MLITISLAAILVALWFTAIVMVIELATRWEDLFISPGVSDTTWAYAIRFIVVGVLGLLYTITALVAGNILLSAISLPLLLFGLAGSYTMNQGLVHVPAKPITRAVLMFWGERQEILLDEGEHLLPSFWPLNITALLEEVEAVEFSFRYTSVPCQGKTDEQGKATIGATVTVEVVGSFQPDFDAVDEHGHSVGARRLMNYQDRGGKEPILTLLRAMIGQELREYSPNYPWEDFVRLKAPMAATLVSDLSVDNPRRLHNIGENLPPNVMNMEGGEYREKPEIDTDPMSYVRENGIDAEETKRRHREMEAYLYQLRENGFGAIPDLGIQLLRFSIPLIDPEGAVKEATDRAAAEKKQQEQEEQDTDTEIKRALKYIEQDPTKTMTLDRALQRVSINRGLGQEIVISGGERSALTDAAAINALAGDKKKE